MGPDKKKIEDLEKKRADLGIRKEDILEKFIKSSGRGGQKVNKTASAVFMRHEKTGISVKYGKHRSQHLNRFFALRLLVEKIQAMITGDDKETEKLEKIRKQKLRRKRKTHKRLAGGAADPCRLTDE